MKNILVIVAFFAFTLTAFAQSNDWHEGRFERSKVYAQVAAEEFNLTEVQQQELYGKKVKHFEAQYEARQKFNKGEITKEEMKAPNKKFGAYFNKLTGKNYKQLKPFYEKVQKEIAKLD